MQPVLVQRLLRVWRNEGIGGLSRRLLDRLRVEYQEGESIRARDAADFWSHSACDVHLRDLSHWKGHGRFADEGRWRAIGEHHVRLTSQLTCLAGREAPIVRVVEWGPGGGANAVAFAPIVKRFFGIDISRPNLDECASRLSDVGFDGFRPVCIEAETPERAVEHVTERCDLFLSTAVFQHFPSREYGARVMSIAPRLLAPDGLALVQIRYDNGNPAYRSKSRNYRGNARTFTSYRIDEFWQIAVSVGFEPLAVTLDPDINYAYFLLKLSSSGVA